MADKGTTGTTITPPLPVWATATIAALLVVVVGLGITLAIVSGGASSGGGAGESHASGGAGSSRIQYASAVAGTGFTFGLYETPGRPGEVTDGGQVIASFLLLAGAGRIDEAMRFVGQNVSASGREYYQAVAREAASRQVSWAEINRSRTGARQFPRDIGTGFLETTMDRVDHTTVILPLGDVGGIGAGWPEHLRTIRVERLQQGGPWALAYR